MTKLRIWFRLSGTVKIYIFQRWRIGIADPLKKKLRRDDISYRSAPVPSYGPNPYPNPYTTIRRQGTATEKAVFHGVLRAVFHQCMRDGNFLSTTSTGHCTGGGHDGYVFGTGPVPISHVSHV